MPVSFNSPSRNLFLLGSSGVEIVTNFFKTIDKSAGTDGVYIPDEIKYNKLDQKYILSGSAQDTQSKGFGWFEKRTQGGSSDWDVRVESPQTSVNTTLRAMELDANDNLIVVGKTADIPWIAKYSNGGVIDWQSTTNSADVEYTGITSDTSGNYYACGSTNLPFTDAQAFVEKFDASGNPGWGKSAFMLGRNVVLNKVAANSRGEVVAVGFLEDDSSKKGYIVKIDTNTGEVLWDRTLSSDLINGIGSGYICQDVFIDNKDQIYVVGICISYETTSFIVKYTAEGNMIWQRETPANFEYSQVKSDGETGQTITFGRYFDPNTNYMGGVLTKYNRDGSIMWRRTLYSSANSSNKFGSTEGVGICLDADPSFYYLLFFNDLIDGLQGLPDSYTYGKLSASGNGLGSFEYTEGTGETISYDILDVQDNIGRLSDGSVRNDSSDLISYPFNGTKILFDDLATQVSNKKRQMDSAGSFEYSGSPAIRVADFQELNLLGHVGAIQGIVDSWSPLSGISDSPVFTFTSTGSLSYNSISFSSVDRITYSLNYSISGGGNFLSSSVSMSIYIEEVGGGIVYSSQKSLNGLSNSTSVEVNYLNDSLDYRLVIQVFVNVPPATAVNVNTTFNISRYFLIPGQDGVWEDQSGNGNNIFESKTYPNNRLSVWPTLNAAGYWEFDGVNDYIALSKTNSLANWYAGPYSIEMWFRADNLNLNSNNKGPLIGLSDVNSNGEWWSLGWNNSSVFNFYYWNGSQQNVAGSTTLSTATWYHAVFTHDSGTITLYLNGSQDGTASVVGTPQFDLGSQYDLTVGASASGYHDGQIGEVRIYPRALTPAQVFQNYNATREKYTGVPASTDPGLTSTRTPA